MAEISMMLVQTNGQRRQWVTLDSDDPKMSEKLEKMQKELDSQPKDYRIDPNSPAATKLRQSLEEIRAKHSRGSSLESTERLSKPETGMEFKEQ